MKGILEKKKESEKAYEKLMEKHKRLELKCNQCFKDSKDQKVGPIPIAKTGYRNRTRCKNW